MSSSNIAALAGVEAVLGKDGLEGLRVGLGVEAGVFDPVDRVEKARQGPRAASTLSA